MSVRYRMSPELNLVVFVGMGAVTGRDLLASVRASLDDPLRVPGMLNILDMINAQDEIEIHDLQAVIELERRFHRRNGAVLLAVLSFSDGMRLLANAITLLSDGTIEAEVFHDVQTAAAWLGLADAAAVETFWKAARS